LSQIKIPTCPGKTTNMTTRPPAKPRRSGDLAIIPAAAVFDRRLSHADVRVLAALSTYANKEGKCWPATTTLASRTGMSKRHVRTCLRSLERGGYIETKTRPGQSSMYRIPRNWSAGVADPDPGTVVPPHPGTGLPGLSRTPELECRGPRNPTAGDPGTGLPPNVIKNDIKNEYAFSGVVLHLTWQNFSAWQEAYKAIPDLRAALQQRDDWLAKLPESDRRRKDWFVPTSNWLANQNKQVRVEPAYDPDVIH
jgi:hypothetical protein